MNEIVIPLSKTKIILLFIGSILFIIAGSWIIYHQTDPRIMGNIKVMLAGYAAVPFFGICAIYSFKKIINKSPGLVIDNVGLIDNSGATSIGRVFWSDVKDVSVLNVAIAKQRFVLIQVTNPQDYIDKGSNGFLRKVMQKNYEIYGSPIQITANTLKCNFDKLYELIQQKFAEHKGA
jgi:hypothetical protein